MISVDSFGQITKEREKTFDGIEYYTTTDKNNRDKYYNNSGLQTIDGNQVIPNLYFMVEPLSGTHGKYFRATKKVGDSIYFDALYDINGNCIIPHTRQYRMLWGNEGWVEVYRERGDVFKHGACSIYTGEELLAPIYDFVDDNSKGEVESENKDNDGHRVTVATCKIPQKGSSSRTNSSSHSNSNQSQSNRVNCWVCDGRGVIYMSYPFTGQMACTNCGGSGSVSFNSGSSNQAGGSYVGTIDEVGTSGGNVGSSNSHQCRVCNGTGSEIYEPYTGSGRSVYCNICQKNFSHAHAHRQCKTCNGTGRVSY